MIEQGAAIALAAKVLDKKLNDTARLEKNVISKIKLLRSTMRSAKPESNAIYLKECLEAEAELIKLYYEDFKLAKSAKVQKQIKNYRKKITATVKNYNTDASHFTALTKTHRELYGADRGRNIRYAYDYRARVSRIAYGSCRGA